MSAKKKEFSVGESAAMQFISVGNDNTEPEVSYTPASTELKNSTSPNIPEPNEHQKNLEHPVEDSISPPIFGELTVLPKKETKSRRVSFLLKESLHKEIREDAKRNKISVNEYVNQILTQAVEIRKERSKQKNKQ